MKKQYFLLTITLSLLIFINLSSASIPEYQTQYPDIPFKFTQVCSDATYITITSIQTPNSTEIINANMTATGSGNFYYNYTTDQYGRYDIRGVSDGCLKTFSVYFQSGNINTIYVIANIILLLFFISGGFVFFYMSHKINYDQWYNSILSKYEGKNSPKVIFSGIAYSFAKESFMTYYLIGWPIVLIMRGFVETFRLTTLTGIMDAIFIIYAIGFAIVGILFFGKLQEFVLGLVDEANDSDWGIKK